jgi:hypothetical protein
MIRGAKMSSVRNPIWIIQDNEFLEDEITKLKMALTFTNTEYKSILFDKFCKSIPAIYVPYGHPVIIYGSIEFVKTVRKIHQEFIPGSYGFNKIDCSDYYTKIPSDLLLNSDYFYITWAEFSRNYKFYFSLFNTDRLFIRPNRGFKTFAGTAVILDYMIDNIVNMNRETGISDDTLILVSSFKELPNVEHRFVIVDKTIVSWSSYGWDSTNWSDFPIDKKVFDAATKIATQDYQLDTAYTVDIVMVGNDAKVIELNSFSSASFYNCNYENIVKAINMASINDFKEVTGIID